MAARLTAGGSRGAQRVPGAVVAPRQRVPCQTECWPLRWAADEDAQARTGAATRLLGDLERHAGSRDDSVASHDALLLDAEDLIEIGAGEGHEGGGGIGRRPGEFGVEAGEEAVAEIAIGRGNGGDAGQAELVHEAALQRAIGALAASAGLRRIAEDVFDAQAGEGATHLGRGAAGGPGGPR